MNPQGEPGVGRESLGRRIARRLRPLTVGLADLRERWFGSTPEVRQPRRVVFVCRGNVCRSVFAEHFMRRNHPDVEVVSAGIYVSVSMPPPVQAIDAGREFGLDLSEHRSRSIRTIEDDPQTHYLVLEPWQARAPDLCGPANDRRVFRLGSWAMPRRAIIDDPYGGSPETFRRCFGLVAQSIEHMTAAWNRQAE